MFIVERLHWILVRSCNVVLVNILSRCNVRRRLDRSQLRRLLLPSQRFQQLGWWAEYLHGHELHVTEGGRSIWIGVYHCENTVSVFLRRIAVLCWCWWICFIVLKVIALMVALMFLSEGYSMTQLLFKIYLSINRSMDRSFYQYAQ